MTNRLKHNLTTWGIYTVIIYIVLIPCHIWVASISISILLGFLFGMLNDIVTELRKINGEKFPNLENKKPEKKDELLKS